MADVQAVPCKKCGGKMRSKAFRVYSRALIISMIVFGVILSLTIVGILIGMPLIILAMHMGTKEKFFWVCEKCNDRIDKHQ